MRKPNLYSCLIYTEIGIELGATLSSRLQTIKNFYENQIQIQFYITSEMYRSTSALYALHDHIVEVKESIASIDDAINFSIKKNIDIIIVDDSHDVDYKFKLKQKNNIYICNKSEAFRNIGCILRGNNIFIDLTSNIIARDFNSLYVFLNEKTTSYLHTYNDIAEKLPNELRENLRSILLNRYHYILYAADMVRFYDINMCFYKRAGSKFTSSLIIGYHVHAFYYYIWGMLDGLSKIVGELLKMETKWGQRGIAKRDFLIELEEIDSQLHSFILDQKVDEFIKYIQIVRHEASHNRLSIPSDYVYKMKEYDTPYDEILKILRKERADEYAAFDKIYIDVMEPLWVDEWKQKYLITRYSGMLRCDNGKGEILECNPNARIDLDITILNTIIDEFIASIKRSLAT